MTIGIVIPRTPAYSETFFRSKIKGLQAHGYDVVLFVQERDADFDLCKVVVSKKVHKNKLLLYVNMLLCKLMVLLRLGAFTRYSKLLKSEGDAFGTRIKKAYLNHHILMTKVDWLHFGFATQALGSEHVAKAMKAQMAVSFRGFDINIYPLKHPQCYDMVWDNVDKAHSISEYLLHKAQSLGLDQQTPYTVIPPAVNSEVLSAYKASSKKGLIICTVARFNWIKDLETAIQTVSILKKEDPDVIYQIIGTGHKIETERLKYLVYAEGLENNVQFLGKLSHDETLKVISQCSLYLQTSLNEGFCNAVLEAQALGKICVVSNVGGLKENVIDGETGFLVSQQTPRSFANKIKQVINLDSEEKKQIRNKARKRVKDSFDLKQQAQQFAEFYK